MEIIELLFGFVFSLKFLLALVVIWLVSSSFFVVRGKTAVILETLGKPHKGACLPGLNFKLPSPITSIVGRVSLQQCEISTTVDVKTKDNAMLKVPVQVQYRASEDPQGAVKAHYELSEHESQITSYVLNVVRQSVSGMTMDEVYANRNTIEEHVKEQVQERFSTFGYTIVNVLVNQPEPDEKVRDAFNRVIASKRELEAAQNDATAEKTRRVGKAEAERDSKKLQGEGIRLMREAVAEGAAVATKKMKEAMPTLDDQQIADFLLAITRLDSMTSVGEHGNLILMDLKGSDQIAQSIAGVRSANHEKVTSITSAQGRS